MNVHGFVAVCYLPYVPETLFSYEKTTIKTFHCPSVMGSQNKSQNIFVLFFSGSLYT